MYKFSRRHFLQASAATLSTAFTATSLTGCASTGTQRNNLPPATNIQLLFYADTHAQWLPSYTHPAANNLGPLSLLGQPPYITEQDRLAALGIQPNTITASWLTAQGARTQPLGKLGGYAALAQALQQQRQTFGTDATLTLEGGQCWNGSGFAHLTQGRFGPISSQWLGAEVKIASEEQLLWPAASTQLYQNFKQPVLTASQPLAVFTKAGVKIAVVGCPNPWLDSPKGFNEQTWVAQLQEQINNANRQAKLVILLSDAGTNPSLWLASQLTGVDVILSSRGQDLWPLPLRLETNSGLSAPVICAGSQAQGFAQLELTSSNQGWQLTYNYHPLLNPEAHADAAVAQQIQQVRASHASWLDQHLATAPCWLYKRDFLAGSWDQLIAQALQDQGADLTFAPGLRHGLALPPGASITREHLFSLTGGYSATVFNIPAQREEVQHSLETGADQLLSDDLFLHTSEDLPRLTGAKYVVRYQAVAGQRIAELTWPVASTSEQLRVAGWSQHYTGQGLSLDQLLEAWLKQQPSNWQLQEIEQPSLAFVDGHPGWHPEALL